MNKPSVRLQLPLPDIPKCLEYFKDRPNWMLLTALVVLAIGCPLAWALAVWVARLAWSS